MRNSDLETTGVGGDASRSAARRVTKRELLLHAGILLVLLVALFPAVCLKGELAVPGTLLFEWPPWSAHQPEQFERATNDCTVEVLTQFTLWYSLTQQAIDAGEWPLWNNLEFTGMPLLANCQSAVLYPLHLLHAFTDVYFAMTCYVLLKIWLCGMTAYVCARLLGLGAPASRFASVAFMLSGYNMAWCYWPLPDVSIWTPVVLIGAELLVNERYRRGAAAMALGGTLLILAGHPETAFCDGAGVGLYFFARLAFRWRQGRPPWKPMLAAGAAWAVVLLVCAVQIIPLLEYIPNSHTAAFRAVHEKDTFFVTFGGLVAMWVPRFFGSTADGNFWGTTWGDLNSTFHAMLYPGVAVWLAMTLLLTRKAANAELRRKALCLAVACGIFMLLACNVSIVAPLSRIPFLKSMRGVYYTGFTAFGLPMLAGLGLQQLLDGQRRLRSLIVPAVVALTASGGVFALYKIYEKTLALEALDEYVVAQVLVSAGIAALSLVALALTCLRRKALGTGLLAAVVACDLLFAAQDLHPTCPREQLFPPVPLTELLKDEGQPIRVNNEATPIRPVILANYGIEETSGYDGIVPGRIIDFRGLALEKAWERLEPLYATTHYVFNEGTFGSPEDYADRFELVAAEDGLEVYRNKRAFPRASLVGQVRVLPDSEAVLAAMCEDAYDPALVAVTDQPPDEALPNSSAAELGEAAVTYETPSTVTIRVSADETCTLVLADAYFPGWEARVRGIPAAVFPVYHNFRAVIVPGGESTVEFTYEPWKFRLGLAVSTATLCAAAILAVVLLLRTRRRDQEVRER